MPSYSVNATIRRATKRRHTYWKQKIVAVYEFWEDPISWSDLKENVLLPAARTIWDDYEQETIYVVVQKHLHGKYKRSVAPGTYRKARLRIGIQDVLAARLTFSHRGLGEVKVERVAFLDPEWYYNFHEGYDEERGKKWELPPVVEPGFEAMLRNPDVNLLFKDSMNLKYLSYAGVPKAYHGSYQEGHHLPGMYAGVPKNLYAARPQRPVENDEQEEENER